ncbi:YTH domain-containing 1 isoform X1 [Olea europaea subsp. europaea]|uniref:YTH domain-containing family protein n=3 Tax=Olea europaea subsp. europaea TaxID=158383 RepID=A0A8S0U053_OLEEU|nr:YTH domain-containing 1 isoform X1 [Olea europaea subsp. europaea]
MHHARGMPSDNAKDNSAFDSSMIEVKKDMANLNDTESPRDTRNEEACRSGVEEQVHSCDQVGTSGAVKKDRLYNTRYFIIKSLNHQNIQLSIKKGLWATQIMNEPILEEAFQNSGKVILIFSVNMSGFFQGYAQMVSSVGWGRDEIWSQGSGKSKPWGRSFKVKWLQLHDLPFQKTLHLKNPWNEYKPVKISRDCQELPQDIGEALCELLDGGDDVDLNLKREEVRDDLSSKWLYKEQLHSFQDEDFNVPLMHMEPMLYPSLLYQNQAEAGRFHLENLRTAGIYLPENSSIATAPSEVKQSKHSRTNGSFASIKDRSSRIDGWGLSAERRPFASTLTEDDILEMTYEEYLEAHSRGNRRLKPTAAGTSRSLQKSSTSKEYSDDSQSGCSSKKRTRHQWLD